MSEADESNHRPTPAHENGAGDQGVMARLPRTRPQRSSPRRAAARKATAPGDPAAPVPPTAAQPPRSPKPSPKPATAGTERKTTAGAPKSASTRDTPAATRHTAPAARDTASPSRARKLTNAQIRAGSNREPARGQPNSAEELNAPAVKPSRRTRRPGAGGGRVAAPRQGFESDSDTARASVQPPGGIELVASAAEMVGEMAKAGLSRSERVLKDIISRLPLS